MNRLSRLLMVMPIIAGIGVGSAVWAGTPTVADVRALQRPDGSGRVDVYYTLSGGSGPMTVSVIVSPDNGATWNVTPSAAHLSGHVGPAVDNGTNRHIVWNAGADRPDISWTQCKVRIIANDNASGPGEITITLPGGVPLVLVRIPAGSFQMGSPDTELSRWTAESPVHPVTIAYDFYLGKYEVTQAQWLAVMGSWPRTAPDAPDSLHGLGADYPAYYVSWDDARNFITTLNTHITAAGQGPATMRLPSEAEWEYACRAGTQTRFYFGDSLGVGDKCKDDGTRSLYMWYCGNNSSHGSKPVGGKQPNAFGLYDMSGNEWEWCEDDWHGSYTGAPADGSPWVSSPRASPRAWPRAVRGGDWFYYARYCRSATRDFHYSSNGYAGIGFRLASVR